MRIREFVYGLRRALLERFLDQIAMYYVHFYYHGDNHLMIISSDPHTVTVYMLGGQQVHDFGGSGSDNLGTFNGLFGI